jgi:hypothetical protein
MAVRKIAHPSVEDRKAKGLAAPLVPVRHGRTMASP